MKIQNVGTNSVLTFSILTFSSFSTQPVKTNSIPIFPVLTFSCFPTQTVRTNSFLTFFVLTFSCFGTKTVRTKSYLTFPIFCSDIFLFWLCPFWLKARPQNDVVLATGPKSDLLRWWWSRKRTRKLCGQIGVLFNSVRFLWVVLLSLSIGCQQ